jgi:hypothetical protein
MAYAIIVNQFGQLDVALKDGDPGNRPYSGGRGWRSDHLAEDPEP